MAETLYEIYQDDPAKLVKVCYNEHDSWFAQFKSRVKENVQLAKNYSEDLNDRKNDETLSRSCLFIPILSPTIFSRSARMTEITFSVDEIIKAKSKPETPEDVGLNVTALLKDILDRNNFQILFLETKLAQEQFPISFWKISEIEDSETELKIKSRYAEGMPETEEFELGKFKEWETGEGRWRPQIDLHTQEAVFYDPFPTKWEYVAYAGLEIGLTTGELVSRKNPPYRYRFDLKELEEKGEKMKENEFREELRTATSSEVKSSIGRVKRWKIRELYIKLEDENGNTIRKIITACGDITLKERNWPYGKLDICDVFIPQIGYPVLNQIEGDTTCDLMKHLQLGLNDNVNITMDAASYALFAPVLWDARVQLLNEMKIGPGVQLEVGFTGAPQDFRLSDATKQLYQVSPVGKDFLVISNLIREIAEIVGGSPSDIFMGGASKPEEKLGQTQMRAGATSSRLAGINILMDVQALKKLGYVLWTMTLERLGKDETYAIESPEAKEFGLEHLMGRLDFEVPHLEGLADKLKRATALMEIYDRGVNDPLFQNPQVRYNLLKEIAEARGVNDFEKILPPEVVGETIELMVKKAILSMVGGAGAGSPISPLPEEEKSLIPGGL